MDRMRPLNPVAVRSAGIRPGRGDEPAFQDAAFVLMALLLAVLYYPLALPDVFGLQQYHAYGIALPSMLVLSTLSIAVLVARASVWVHDRWLSIGLLAYIGCVAVGACLNGAALHDAVSWAGRITVPLALAVCLFRFEGNPCWRRAVAGAFSLLWLGNIVSCLVAGNASGLCGNPNWMAATTMATAPFAYHLLGGARTRRDGRLTALGIYLLVLVAGLTLLTVGLAGCRASIVAISCYVAVWLIAIRTSRVKRFILILACGLVGIAGLTRHAELRRIHLADVRIPMWCSTAGMIADKPVLGHGAGRFRSQFPRYKVQALEQRLSVAAITEHPHNEPLLVAANLGIPAAVIWLMVCVAAIRTAPHESRWEAPRFAAVTLFAHGLFDKTLDTSPSSIVFPIVIAMGLALRLSRGTARRQPVHRRSRMSARLVAACSISAISLAGYGLVLELRSGIEHRRGLRLLDMSHHTFDHDARTRFAEQAYISEVRAGQTASDPVENRFYAACIACEDLERFQDGMRHYRWIRAVEPGYAYADFLMGRCELMSALDPSTRRPEQVAAMDRAIELLMSDLESHPFTTRVHEDLVLALMLRGEYERALEHNVRLTRIYQTQFRMDCAVDGQEPGDRLKSWLDVDAVDYRRRIQGAGTLTDWVRLNTRDNLACRLCTGTLRRTRAYASSATYCRPDAAFWSEIMRLESAFNGLSAAEEMITRVSEVRATGTRQRYSWPWEVWAQRSGTDLDVACLIAAISQQHGHPCVVLRSENRLYVILEWDDNVHICRLKDRHWSQFSRRSWTQMSDEDKTDAMPGFADPHHDASVFVYPQALCHRNRALFEILRSDPAQHAMPENPNVTIARASLAFPSLSTLEYLSQPFERLESDLSE